MLALTGLSRRFGEAALQEKKAIGKGQKLRAKTVSWILGESRTEPIPCGVPRKGVCFLTTEHNGQVSGFVHSPASQTQHDPQPVRPISILATSDETGGTLGVIDEFLAPGEQAPPHIHHAADELLYVVAGEFTFQIGDFHAGGGSGAVAFVPRGTVHSWQNSGNTRGRMLFVFTPAGFEGFIAEGPARARLELEVQQPGTINRMAARYQTTYVNLPPATAE